MDIESFSCCTLSALDRTMNIGVKLPRHTNSPGLPINIISRLSGVVERSKEWPNRHHTYWASQQYAAWLRAVCLAGQLRDFEVGLTVAICIQYRSPPASAKSN